MSIYQGVQWALQLVPKLFTMMDSWMITEGVSVLSFSVAMILLLVIIGSIVMRV